ncbi:MAG: PEP-CTERM sorting domain-containing protein [Candidatus Acidiferrales bacterium]
MRKYVAGVGALGAILLIGLVAAPAALAGNISLTLNSTTPSTTTFTISGTYAPGVPTTSISVPNDPYSMSFTLATNPSSLSSFDYDTAAGAFVVNANFTLTLDGGTPMTFATPFMVEFATDNGGNLGGLIFCFDDSGTCSSDTDWDIIGQQLFTGNVSDPTFISTANASINQTMSGYFINGSGQFPFGTAPAPEPASLLLLGTGLCAAGLVTRKRLRLG